MFNLPATRCVLSHNYALADYRSANYEAAERNLANRLYKFIPEGCSRVEFLTPEGKLLQMIKRCKVFDKGALRCSKASLIIQLYRSRWC